LKKTTSIFSIAVAFSFLSFSFSFFKMYAPMTE
jgi:hypothetical protein